MLVLGRKVGEAIVIADNITVRIMELSNHHVKLGIEAPPQVTVHREEVQRQMEQTGVHTLGPKHARAIDETVTKQAQDDLRGVAYDKASE